MSSIEANVEPDKPVLKGWRTLLTAASVSVAGAVAAVPAQLQDLGLDWKSLLPSVIPTKYVGLGLVVLGLLFAFLRMITHSSAAIAINRPPPGPQPYPQGPPPNFNQYAPPPIPPAQMAPPT